MKVYTKTGDQGMTGLLTGERIEKDSLRVEAYGAVDEVNSALGVARSWCRNENVQDTVYKLQKLLMLAMADLASITSSQPYVTADHVALLEQTIDAFDEQLPKLTEFIIPGDTQGGAALDLARTITRRAERLIIRLSKQEQVSEEVLIAFNRLSDLCFVLARVENQE